VAEMEIRKLCNVDRETTWQEMTFVSIDEHNNHRSEYEINFVCQKCGFKKKEILTHKDLSDLMAGDKWRERQHSVA